MGAHLLAAAAAAAAATIVALAAPPGAEARGYTCNYRADGVTMTLDGLDNQARSCRLFNSEFDGRRVGSHPGRMYCSWEMRLLDIRAAVWSTSPTLGRLFCSLMAPSIPRAEWRRTR